MQQCEIFGTRPSVHIFGLAARMDCYLIEAARHLLRMLTQKNVLCENSIDLSL